MENNSDGDPPRYDAAAAEPQPPGQPFRRTPDVRESSAGCADYIAEIPALSSGRPGMPDAGLDNSLQTIVEEGEGDNGYQADSGTGESTMGRRADRRASRRHADRNGNEILIIPLGEQSSSSCSGYHRRRAPRQERAEILIPPEQGDSNEPRPEYPHHSGSPEREEILIDPGNRTPGARHPSLTPRLPQDRDEILIYPGRTTPGPRHPSLTPRLPQDRDEVLIYPGENKSSGDH
ncbi:hypothetical protein GX51_02781 [Blastomyces parvus]|uniref:Uncharacterized protein n=1 Tax=Blastomyces parvus TaxID=2060905 RepID=A0A2B7XAY4_9EURO|nr:hypothetical protein GX51_02781 [Blastomyces parvus]